MKSSTDGPCGISSKTDGKEKEEDWSITFHHNTRSVTANKRKKLFPSLSTFPCRFLQDHLKILLKVKVLQAWKNPARVKKTRRQFFLNVEAKFHNNL